MQQIAHPNYERTREYLAAGALSPYSRILLLDYLEKVIDGEIRIYYDDDMVATDPLVAEVHARVDLSAILYVGELPPLERFYIPPKLGENVLDVDDIDDAEDNDVAVTDIFGAFAYISHGNFWIGRWGRGSSWMYNCYGRSGPDYFGLPGGRTFARYISLFTRSEVVFVPWLKQRIDTGNAFNLFAGFAHDYDPNFVINEETIALIRFHLREVWCSGVEDKFDYLIKWLACILQRPQEKLPTFIVVYPLQCCSGRRIMCNFLMDKVFGAALTSTAMSIDVSRLFGKYNAVFEHKLLITAAANGKITRVLDRQEITIKRKRGPTYTLPDLANYIILPERKPQLRKFAGRQFLHLQTRQQTVDYCSQLFDAMTFEAGKHFFHYLANIDLTNFDPRNL